MNKRMNGSSFYHLEKLLFQAASALTLGCCGCDTKEPLLERRFKTAAGQERRPNRTVIDARDETQQPNNDA